MKHVFKTKLVILLLLLSVVFVTGCGKTNMPSPSPTGTTTNTASPTGTATGTATTSPTVTPGEDVKTTASMVNTAVTFEKAISKNGTWIICLLSDITVNKDLTLDGEFTNGKKDSAGKDIIQRKIALYEQDANRKVTARHTLTVPKLTINSPEASIQRGTFKGDLYVTAKNFQLVDTTVEGNVYFTNDEAKSTFKMDETSKITGKQELKK